MIANSAAREALGPHIVGQDARVDVDAALEQAITDRYCDLRRQTGPFDRAAFERDYAIMAAQRVTKILGIFVRLDEQDGKPAYLEHMPRLHGYLERSFAHPVLKAYRDWYRRVIGTAGA